MTAKTTFSKHEFREILSNYKLVQSNDMLFPSLDPDEDINLSRLEETKLPPDARDLLSKLLAANPDERPQRAQTVKRWLEQI